MRTVRVAINGFGRIGRAFARIAHGKGVALVAVNDIGSLESLGYLLKYDTVYGRAPFKVTTAKNSLMVDGKEVKVFSEKEPSKLPWKELNIDIVIESSGFFTDYEKAKAHLAAGAKRVVISAPGKGDEGSAGQTVLMGVNAEKIGVSPITSNASCTTNAASPVVAILDEHIGIETALLNTTHGYTASQALVDGALKRDLREGRAAAANIVPSSTGAAEAVAKAYPKLTGKFDGISLRVPVIAGSIADITFIAKRDTSAEEVNNILRKAADTPHWQGIFAASDEPLVSSDIVGDTRASIADLAMTRVVGKRLVKVLAWYDNEMGYASTLLMHVLKAGEALA